MLGCGLRTKNALYLKTYTTFQLYELPSINREVFFYQNQVSNLFCGDGWTKLSFFGPCSLTICFVSYLARILSAEGLGISSDVASDCVAPIAKIKMADDGAPASSGKKRPLTDDAKGLSVDGAVEQKEYLVS